MGLLSTERRQERYKILYTWKALAGKVPSCGISLAQDSGTRKGLTARVPPLSGTRRAIQSLREYSLSCEGPRLYNCVPAHLRSLEVSFETFKAGVDRWLQGVPDLPWTQFRYHPAKDLNGSISNSLRAWACIPVSELPCVQVPELPHGPVTELPCVPVPVLPCAQVPELPCVQVTELPCGQVTELPHDQVTELPRGPLTELPRVPVPVLPRGLVTEQP